MLHHPTVDKLHALRLPGMAAALAEQQSQDGIDRLALKNVWGCWSSVNPVNVTRDKRWPGCAGPD